MRLKNCVVALLLHLLLSHSLNAQSNIWGVRGCLHSVGLLSASDFNAEGFSNKKTYSAGLTFTRIVENTSYTWAGYVTGLTYRHFNITSKTSSTNFQLSWVEIPFDYHRTFNLYNAIPIGFSVGLFGAMPTEYKGSIARYQLPSYEYGNKKYEKPAFILGLLLGPTLSFRVKHIYTTLFAGYNLSFIPISPKVPEGVTKDYKTPLPSFLEFGLAIGYSKNILKGD